MRSLVIVALMFAAGSGACGSGGAAGAHATTRETGGSYANRARPATSERGARVIAAVQRAADDVCRCGDGLCADAVVQKLGRAIHGQDDVMLTTSEQSAMMHAVARIDKCRARLFGRGEQAARVAERWAEETCACADAGCAELAARRGADELRRYGDAEGNDDEVRRIVIASRQVKSCMRQFGLTGQL
jgi:hypothetical protein